MPKTVKNTTVKEPVVKPLDKDYAHYPPTTLQIVTKPLTKKLKKTEKTPPSPQGDTNNTGYTGTRIHHGVTEDDERILNGTDEIVNGEEETYSVGSGGAFEATEQV